MVRISTILQSTLVAGGCDAHEYIACNTGWPCVVFRNSNAIPPIQPNTAVISNQDNFDLNDSDYCRNTYNNKVDKDTKCIKKAGAILRANLIQSIPFR